VQRVVIVTGGSSGIGAATAARFVEGGASVVVFDVAKPDEPLDGVSYAVVDVSEPDAVRDAVDEVVRDAGRIDVAIANAGISFRHAAVDITPDEWSAVLRVNLDGVFWLWQAVGRHMLAAGGGVLLATASTNALVGHPFYADYNASKAGVVTLTRTLALEWAPTVRVNCVGPGYVLTPMQEREYTPEMLAEVNRYIPAGRHAMPREVADLFHYLASDAAQYITGQCIAIDGGETAGGVASRRV
jgi:NAD(P)-dependent dehydrogenase (short-subunit alcohol dehydrogenase family)